VQPQHAGIVSSETCQDATCLRPPCESWGLTQGSDPSRSVLAPLAVPAAAAAAPVAVAATRPLLRPLARRCVLGPLDQLLRRDRAAVLVLLDQLQADPATRLVDLLHDHVQDVAAVDHILDVTHPAGADVRNVQQAV